MTLPGSLRTRLGVVAGTAALLGLAGCYASSEAHPVFEKDGMRAEGPNATGVFTDAIRGDETFLGMSNDMFRRRPRPLPRFCVQLSPEAPPTTTDALTRDFVARWLPHKVLKPEEGALIHRDHDVFMADGLLVGTPQSAVADAARVGPPSCSPLYAFPLTRAQLIEVLGEPDYEGWQRGEGNLLLLL
jgi:hypothetical protein